MDAEERRSTIFRSAAEEFVLVLARAPQSLHASLAQSKQTRAREGAREGELALLAFERGERDGVVESHPVRAEGRESLEFREPRRREIFQLDARRLERGALLGGHRAVGSVRILGRGARARAREPHREGAAQRRLDVSPLAPLEVEERSHHVHRRAIQRGMLRPLLLPRSPGRHVEGRRAAKLHHRGGGVDDRLVVRFGGLGRARRRLVPLEGNPERA